MPTGITNCSDPLYFPGCWRDHDVALYVHIYDGQGARIPTLEQHERDLHNRGKLTSLSKSCGFQILQNGPQELGLVARRLMETTIECQGWRESSTLSEPPVRPNVYHFPMTPRIRVPIVEFPDLAPQTR
jgi:hypothetical protein